MIHTIQYRRFHHQIEDPEAIFSLFDLVYGDSVAIRKRWNWEILSHPDSSNIFILVAEQNRRVVGMTVRMPYALSLQEGVQPVFFATNSLVAPDCQGQGIIGKLYDMAVAETSGLQFSKGTAAAMHSVLIKKGYQDVVPSNYQIALLAPIKWLLRKMIKRNLFQPHDKDRFLNYDTYLQIDCFPTTFNDFARTAISGIGGGLLKTSDYMNWRYFQIPHRQYKVFLRYHEEMITSMLVMKFEGVTAYLVDILWDASFSAELPKMLEFAKLMAKKLGAVKLIAWGSNSSFRDACKQKFFFNSKESPSFSWFSAQHLKPLFDICSMHIVHGDGDIEYL